MENIIKTIREALIVLKYVIPPQLKRIALILENVLHPSHWTLNRTIAQH